MSVLVFDTETTGLPRKELAYNHPEQARIVQLACLVLDNEFKEVASFYSLVRPSGWQDIHPKAQEAHGITVEMCNMFGVPMEHLEHMFNAYYHKCDRVVAHNVAFDKQLIDIERAIILGDTDYDWNKSFCTMQAMTPVCKLPKKYQNGNGVFKWPNLQEAYTFCFNEPFVGAHDALVDVRATARIYKWLAVNKLTN